MTESHSITQWIDQLRDGDASATRNVWNAFYERLVAVASRQLGAGRARLADGEDVAAEAFATFYRRVEGGHFPDLRDREGLWRLLLTIAERRARNRARDDRAQKRGGGQVRGDSIFVGAVSTDGRGFDQFAGNTPSPDDVAVMHESLDVMLKQLTSEQRDIALLKMQSYSNREISEQVSCSVATVERRLKQIRETWAHIENV